MDQSAILVSKELMMVNQTEKTVWMTVRNHSVPWFLFLATTLAAVILACRG